MFLWLCLCGFLGVDFAARWEGLKSEQLPVLDRPKASYGAAVDDSAAGGNTAAGSTDEQQGILIVNFTGFYC